MLYTVNASMKCVHTGIVRAIPTFFLDGNVQGITTLAHAKQIAEEVINPFKEKHKMYITVTCGDKDYPCEWDTIPCTEMAAKIANRAQEFGEARFEFEADDSPGWYNTLSSLRQIAFECGGRLIRIDTYSVTQLSSETSLQAGRYIFMFD